MQGSGSQTPRILRDIVTHRSKKESFEYKIAALDTTNEIDFVEIRDMRLIALHDGDDVALDELALSPLAATNLAWVAL
jgi:hypothetical protein